MPVVKIKKDFDVFTDLCDFLTRNGFKAAQPTFGEGRSVNRWYGRTNKAYLPLDSNCVLAAGLCRAALSHDEKLMIVFIGDKKDRWHCEISYSEEISLRSQFDYYLTVFRNVENLNESRAY